MDTLKRNIEQCFEQERWRYIDVHHKFHDPREEMSRQFIVLEMMSIECEG